LSLWGFFLSTREFKNSVDDGDFRACMLKIVWCHRRDPRNGHPPSPTQPNQSLEASAMCVSSPKVCLRAAQNYIKNSKYEKDCIVARRSFVPVEKQCFSLAAGSKSKAERLHEMDHPMDELSGRSQQKGGQARHACALCDSGALSAWKLQTIICHFGPSPKLEQTFYTHYFLCLST